MPDYNPDLLEMSFLVAAFSGNLKRVKECVDAGVDIHVLDSEGNNAKALTQKRNLVELTGYLISLELCSAESKNEVEKPAIVIPDAPDEEEIPKVQTKKPDGIAFDWSRRKLVPNFTAAILKVYPSRDASLYANSIPGIMP